MNRSIDKAFFHLTVGKSPLFRWKIPVLGICWFFQVWQRFGPLVFLQILSSHQEHVLLPATCSTPEYHETFEMNVSTLIFFLDYLYLYVNIT